MVTRKIWGLLIFLLVTTPAQACPVCNVDGPATKSFLIAFMGSAILGMVFLLLWSVGGGHYKKVENPKHRILQLDRKTGVRK